MRTGTELGTAVHQHFNPDEYQAQLAEKVSRTNAEFTGTQVDLEIFPSAPRNFRMRAEFKIWHQDGQLDYAMFAPGDNRTVIKLAQYPVGSDLMESLMPRLKQSLERNPILSQRLFQVDFLTTTIGEAVITLIYHRPLDAAWSAAATDLAEQLKVGIVGRSRKQKIIVNRDWAAERFTVNGRHFHYRQHEGSFTQPNGGINQCLLNWATDAAGRGGQLLELYCGSGNFTLPLAQGYERVIATEINKAAIAQAQVNCGLNGVSNIEFVRISSEDFAAAKAGVRPFFRLRNIPVESMEFQCVLVDPPRSGLDTHTLALLRPVPKVIYISCNPASLQRDLQILTTTHTIKRLALFDQFPYTSHREIGVCLTAKSTL